ncbi:hypothetical protein [Fluviicola sp.]|uniref:hypothetical protein n=1 Tax=Fluviicola sp. TaxID=1917219 RepID=UPI0031D85C62
MGLDYSLVNVDKKEIIDFYGVDTGTHFREIPGTVIASTIVTYYLIKNAGDRIGFISDISLPDVPEIICGEEFSFEYLRDFTEVTDRIIDELIEQEIIKDHGIVWIDKEDNLFYRDLRNIWDVRISYKENTDLS